MTRQAAPYLCWIDLETTGLDPHADPILEVGAIITEATAPYPAMDSLSCVVLPDGPSWSHRFPPRVLQMHTENGLLADVFDGGIPIGDVERDLVGILGNFGSRHDFVLAGSGVAHFDRAFIAAQMPTLDKWLRYGTLDVGVLRRTLESFVGVEALLAQGLEVGTVGSDKAHRGLADIESHLAELRFYAERLVDVGP